MKIFQKMCGGGEIRTLEGLCHWILSPAPLDVVMKKNGYSLDPFWCKMALTKLGNPSTVKISFSILKALEI